MKKVIFVGGNSFSGTTVLDMILANDPGGFSCGEVYAIFQPSKPHHYNPECGCGNRSCNIWDNILENGPDKVYESIFELHPGVNFVVDSSKDQFWIRRQTDNLCKRDINIENILIWKTPLEAASSFKKRNLLQNWERSWINYHRLYFTLIDSFRAVKYKKIASEDEEVLQGLCEYLEIDFFQDKYKFWTKTHHTLFGNTSAKVHLYSQESEKYSKSKETLEKRRDNNLEHKYQRIYYNEIDDKELLEFTRMKKKENKYFEKIVNVLNSSDILGNGSILVKSKVKYSLIEKKLLKLLRLIKQRLKVIKIKLSKIRFNK